MKAGYEVALAFDPLLVHRYHTDRARLELDLELLTVGRDFMDRWKRYPGIVHPRPLVTGFAFSADMSRVVLIGKTRPKWQAGKYNGVGGKPEVGDLTSMHVLSREFEEETGAIVPWTKWQHFVTLNSCMSDGSYNTIAFFFVCDDEVLNMVSTTTDEVVEVFNVEDIVTDESVPLLANIPWLVAMARAHSKESSAVMTITEHGNSSLAGFGL